MDTRHDRRISRGTFLWSGILGLALYPMAVCGGVFPSVEPLTGRSYVRTNTWNGCVSYAHGKETTFRAWKCPYRELLAAVHSAFHYARYGRPRTIPMSYYETGRYETSGAAVTVYGNLDQFSPPVEYEFEIGGESVARLNTHVLPFAVSTPRSRTDLHCVLVVFSTWKGEFAFGVYVNVNEGTASLDFHEAVSKGFMFIASESRYPYLTRQECRKQAEVYVKYFSPPETKEPKPKRNDAKRPVTHTDPDVEIVPPDL